MARSASNAPCYPSNPGSTASTSLLSLRERKSIRDSVAQPSVSNRVKRQWETSISRTCAAFGCTLGDRQSVSVRSLPGAVRQSLGNGRLVDHEPVQADALYGLTELVKVHRLLNVTVRSQFVTAGDVAARL